MEKAGQSSQLQKLLKCAQLGLAGTVERKRGNVKMRLCTYSRFSWHPFVLYKQIVLKALRAIKVFQDLSGHRFRDKIALVCQNVL